ncbi:hypothetical protein [Streptomyces sp. AC555_RSS877]|uniref:hypothetical protein n=1 Tax=Streptomyces sp. AC555_RSS877 TaxID=2823688 RepID=UPI0027E458BB|nr:hypothetical protein [Streptomyces sp. AC555_RSS877]
MTSREYRGLDRGHAADLRQKKKLVTVMGSTSDRPPEGEGLAEVRIIAADPDVAQRVALVLREVFPCDEPRSYPTGPDGFGTLLHLTVDTGHTAEASPEPSNWLVSSRSKGQRAHTDEPG